MKPNLYKKLGTFLLIAISALSMACSKKYALEMPESPSENVPGNVKKVMAVGDGTLSDTNIKYFGRWDFSDPAHFKSYWGGAYIKVKFTGTSVKLKLSDQGDYYAKIDNGPWVSYKGASGTVNLTPTALSNATHSLSVAQGKDYSYVFNFDGLVLDNGAHTVAPDVAANLIEYIGDSITAGYTNSQANVSDYAWVASEILGAEHTQIAYPGIKLVSNPGIGMDVQYFKTQSLNYPSSPNWDFTKYTAKVVVINLGTNDGNQVDDEVFKNTYITFLANIRAKYPNAEIFAMRTFLGIKATPTFMAVNARIAAGDAKVHYINTDGWLISGSSDYDPSDGTHPNDSGQIKAGNLLKNVLAPYLNGTAVPIPVPEGTYKIVNRNSGLVLDAQGQLTANGTPITQWGHEGGDNQKWVLTSLGGDLYKIIGLQSAKSLDVTGESVQDGAKIQLYQYTGGNNQKWILTATSGGYFTVTNALSGKVIDIGAASTAPGALAQQWFGNGGTNQQWSFQAP